MRILQDILTLLLQTTPPQAQQHYHIAIVVSWEGPGTFIWGLNAGIIYRKIFVRSRYKWAVLHDHFPPYRKFQSFSKHGTNCYGGTAGCWLLLNENNDDGDEDENEDKDDESKRGKEKSFCQTTFLGYLFAHKLEEKTSLATPCVALYSFMRHTLRLPPCTSSLYFF